MNAVHVELSVANAFVEARHRHHKPCTGHRFSIGAVKRERDSLAWLSLVVQWLA